MVFVDYNSSDQFVRKIGERCNHIDAVDSWENICGCYTLDLNGSYLFLYSERDDIFLEYHGGKYPIAMCSCSYHAKEDNEKFWEAREIWKIEIHDDDKSLVEIYYTGGYNDSEYKTENPNFGQYISLLNENMDLKNWYLFNHTQNHPFDKIYLTRLPYINHKISYDGTSIQNVDASYPMRDGYYESDVDGHCSMLYVQDQRLILLYRNSKFYLDDPNLTIDCDTNFDGEERMCNLKIEDGTICVTMRYSCLSADFWGDEEEWEYNWGYYIKKIKEENIFRKQVYDEIMFLKKR